MQFQDSKNPCLIGHHPHSHEDHGPSRSQAMSRLKAAFFLSLGFVSVEILGAWISGSLALFADAMHMLADSAAIGFGLLAGILASRASSERRSYGYYRLEVLAALINGLLLFGMAAFIAYEAYERWNSDYSIRVVPLFVTAGIGLLVNILMLRLMHSSHQHNLNIRGVFFHIVGDTLSSVAVLLGAIVIYYTNENWPDLIASLFVAGMIGIMAGKLVWDAGHILLEGTPKHIRPMEIQNRLQQEFSQIKNIHDFHIWEISSKLLSMTAHLEVELTSFSESESLLKNLNSLVEREYGITHTTFQLEACSTPPAKASN